jgi:16S rRNA (guanine527-N7)-methyltransferase
MTKDSTHELAPALEAGLDELGLAMPCEARDKLLAYVDLLAKWNGTYNLTAIRDRAQMVSLHLLDSLCVARYVKAGRLLDVGSGGGLPGIPLAIYAAVGLPDLHITVLDSNHKKAAFLRQAKAELKLTNLDVANERVEAWEPPAKFTQIVSRAFSDLYEFFHLTEQLGAPGCEWLAMKGVHPHDEIAQLPAQCKLEQVHALKVPGVAAERHLVVLRAA